jgi:hypothetical protein
VSAEHAGDEAGLDVGFLLAWIERPRGQVAARRTG